MMTDDRGVVCESVNMLSRLVPVLNRALLRLDDVPAEKPLPLPKGPADCGSLTAGVVMVGETETAVPFNGSLNTIGTNDGWSAIRGEIVPVLIGLVLRDPCLDPWRDGTLGGVGANATLCSVRTRGSGMRRCGGSSVLIPTSGSGTCAGSGLVDDELLLYVLAYGGLLT